MILNHCSLNSGLYSKRIKFIIYILLFSLLLPVMAIETYAGTKIKNLKRNSAKRNDTFYSLYYQPDEYKYPVDEGNIIYGKDFIEVKDPFEKFNRKMLVVNGFFDYIAIRPLATAYNKVTPVVVKKAVTNSLDNLKAPATMSNSLLQGKVHNAFASFWGFVLNSTLGFGGTFDFMGEYGDKATEQDFGKTLAYYGARPGPYLVLPIYGPTTVRDGIRYFSFLNPAGNEAVGSFIFVDSKSKSIVTSRLPKHIKSALMPVGIISGRAKSLEFSEKMKEQSDDIYTTIRNAYFYNREANVEYPKRIKNQYKSKNEHKQNSKD